MIDQDFMSPGITLFCNYSAYLLPLLNDKLSHGDGSIVPKRRRRPKGRRWNRPRGLAGWT